MGWKSKSAAIGLSLAIGLVTLWEGYEPEVYLDPVGIPTVCYGHVEKGLVVGETFSFDKCHELLSEDLLIAAAAVKRLTTVELPPNVQAAMISFTYNLGAHQFATSTMRKLLNQGRFVEACHELPKWDKGNLYNKKTGQIVLDENGKPVKVRINGLTNRRMAEMEMCLGTHVTS